MAVTPVPSLRGIVPDPKTQNIIVALSGGGRTLENLLQNQQSRGYRVVGVIASRPDCRGVTVAQKAGLPVFVETFASGGTSAQTIERRDRIYRWLATMRVRLVVLAGFLRPFPVIAEWEKAIINIHPGLLPTYGGKGMYGEHVHAAVLAAGDAHSGATVHFVNDRYDEGQLIAEAHVPVVAGDTPETLAARVFAAECDVYPRVIQGLMKGDLPRPCLKVWRYKYSPGTLDGAMVDGD